MSEQLDPTKYHVLSSTQKRNIIIALLLVFILTLPSLGYLYYTFAINRPAQSDKELTFEIKRGESTAEISRVLYERGAINSAVLFNIYVYLNKLDKNIQAGVYNIGPGSSIVALVDQFQHGKNDVKITFLEGWRLEEYALAASKTFDSVEYEEFVKSAKDNEGFLFPDTYILNIDITAAKLVEILGDNFKKKTADTLTDGILKNIGMSMEEVVTIASIVEREARDEEDRPLVAGILVKRWKTGQPLGADATLQYIIAAKDCCLNESQASKIEWWPAAITQTDLEIENPYNTRKIPGLPPAPISNPGLSSIKAVVNYKETEYNYYLHDKEGSIHFAKTLDEHNQNVKKYLGF